MEGFHVEGPHISPEEGPRGAHPARWVRPPRPGRVSPLAGRRERKGSPGDALAGVAGGHPLHRTALQRRESPPSIGHTKAGPEQIQDAVSAGATLSTHLGNGAHATLPRHPNYIWEQLAEDRLAASFIVDGMHLAGIVSCAWLCGRKAIERSVLVTDAVAPAMCAAGPYRLGEVEIELREDGRVVAARRRAAGRIELADGSEPSATSCAWPAFPWAKPWTMATRNPARVGNIAGRMRGLETGDRADLVRFVVEDGRLRVLETFVSGRRVYASSV